MAELTGSELTEMVAPDDRAEILQGLAELDAALGRVDGLDAVVIEGVARDLQGQPEAETLTTVINRLQGIFQEPAATVPMWTFTSGEPWRLDWLEQEGSASVRALAFLRTLGARCGIEIAEAYKVWRELPNNWSNINREVFLDLISDTYRVKMRVTKYSGEEVEFEGNADTMLDLTMQFLRTLNYIPRGYLFTPSVAENFIAEAESLIETIKAGAEAPAETPAEAPTVSA